MAVETLLTAGEVLQPSAGALLRRRRPDDLLDLGGRCAFRLRQACGATSFRGYSCLFFRSPVGEIPFQLREQVHQTKPQLGQLPPNPFRMHQSHIGE